MKCGVSQQRRPFRLVLAHDFGVTNVTIDVRMRFGSVGQASMPAARSALIRGRRAPEGKARPVSSAALGKLSTR